MDLKILVIFSQCTARIAGEMRLIVHRYPYDMRSKLKKFVALNGHCNEEHCMLIQ
jgi:hypothetical protein